MSVKSKEHFLHWLIDNDPRFHPNAYVFTLEALHYTQKLFQKKRHVSGQQLLIGISHLAKEKFGPLAWTVLQEWGIKQARDFGDIVFNMVEMGEIKKTKDDTIDDFDIDFDLKKELEKV